MKVLLENNRIRHFIRIIIACIFTYLLYEYLYHKVWWLMLVSTVFVMMTSTGSAIFQGILRFFLMIVLVILVYAIFPHVGNFYSYLDVVVLGSFAGIMINTLVFPDRIDIEFKKKAVPLLKASRDYFSAIITYLIDKNADRVNQAKIQMENTLLFLPLWVYKPGFDVALQKGYRYYFMKLNHLAEILFAMHYLARYPYDREWIASIENSLLQCSQCVAEFVAAIITLLDLEKLKEGVTDFADNINDMEILFNKMVPVPLELLEKHKDFKYLAEFIHNIRELRVVLIQLAKALR